MTDSGIEQSLPGFFFFNPRRQPPFPHATPGRQVLPNTCKRWKQRLPMTKKAFIHYEKALFVGYISLIRRC